MKILDCATDQIVPGALGGSVHVQSVAEGLARLGHEVHVASALGEPPPDGGVVWHELASPWRSAHLRLFRAGDTTRLARELRPDVIMERYHNFGGEGVLAAKRIGAPLVLEVNAPVIDHAGSLKHILDRAMLVEPARRWRDWQCRRADLIVTPMSRILPPWVPATRILEIEWGADTDRFRPDATGTVPFARQPGQVTLVFAGAFRPWHGAIQLVRAMRQLRARGRTNLTAVLIGTGPELARVRAEAEALDNVILTGAVAHDRMPACLAAADIGVAPFDVTAHQPLQLGFYWSPLKVFEYMAAGLPVIAPNLDRLSHIVRHDREGMLYDPAEPSGLAGAIETLIDSGRRHALGSAARMRVETEFSWAVHCRRLDRAVADVVSRAGRAACAS